MTLNQIIEAILKLAEKDKHPDKVTGIHTVLMRVNMRTGEEMRRIRDDERRKL